MSDTLPLKSHVPTGTPPPAAPGKKDDAAGYRSGIGPTWKPGVTRVISVDEKTGQKIPGSERRTAQPPAAAPHVEGKSVETEEDQSGNAEGREADPDDREGHPPSPGTELPPSADPSVPATPPADDVPPVSTKPEETTSQFLKLSKKERQLRERETKIKENETKLDKILNAQKAYNENPSPENAQALLDASGTSYDALTKAFLPKAEPDKAELALKKAEDIEKKITTQEEDQEQKDVDAAWGEVRTIVKSNQEKLKEKYELTCAFGEEAVELATQILWGYYQKTGKGLTIEEAFNETEKYYDGLAKRFEGTKRFKSLVQVPPAGNGNGAPPSEGQPGPKENQRPRTLTNSHSTATPHPTDRKMTREEKRAQMKAMIKFIET